MSKRMLRWSKDRRRHLSTHDYAQVKIRTVPPIRGFRIKLHDPWIFPPLHRQPSPLFTKLKSKLGNHSTLQRRSLMTFYFPLSRNRLQIPCLMFHFHYRINYRCLRSHHLVRAFDRERIQGLLLNEVCRIPSNQLQSTVRLIFPLNSIRVHAERHQIRDPPSHQIPELTTRDCQSHPLRIPDT